LINVGDILIKRGRYNNYSFVKVVKVFKTVIHVCSYSNESGKFDKEKESYKLEYNPDGSIANLKGAYYYCNLFYYDDDDCVENHKQNILERIERSLKKTNKQRFDLFNETVENIESIDSMATMLLLLNKMNEYSSVNVQEWLHETVEELKLYADVVKDCCNEERDENDN